MHRLYPAQENILKNVKRTGAPVRILLGDGLKKFDYTCYWGANKLSNENVEILIGLKYLELERKEGKTSFYKLSASGEDYLKIFYPEPLREPESIPEEEDLGEEFYREIVNIFTGK